MTSVAMSACLAIGRVERRYVDALIRPSDGAAEHHRRRWRQVPAQPRERVAELPRPRPRHGIVERDHKTRACRGIEPALDQLPRFEIVGQRKRAEIVAERRADPRRDGKHGGNAGNEGDIERAPRFGSGLDGFAYGGRHGENAGVAARHDGDVARRARHDRARRRRARPLRDCRTDGDSGRRRIGTRAR